MNLMYTAQGQQASSKNDLVIRHAPLVKRIAYHLIGRLPASVLVDDLIQAGMLGLLDAANQYDARQGASFETYATIRVRGAMLDELRRNDWAPKSVHRKMRDLSEAIQQVEAETGRDATDQEVARKLGVSLDEYFQILQDASNSKLMSLDDLSGVDGGGYDEWLASGESAPPEALQGEQFRRSLAEAIGKLPERERLIMALYYDKELNLKEIGAVLQVTESRVSQLLSQAHARLRARLSEFRD